MSLLLNTSTSADKALPGQREHGRGATRRRLRNATHSRRRTITFTLLCCVASYQWAGYMRHTHTHAHTTTMAWRRRVHRRTSERLGVRVIVAQSTTTIMSSYNLTHTPRRRQTDHEPLVTLGFLKTSRLCAHCCAPLWVTRLRSMGRRAIPE